MAALQQTLLKGLKTARVNQVSDKYVKDAWQHYRHEDTGDMPKKQAVRRKMAIDINLTDANAIRYLTFIDRHYFGSGNYLANNPDVGGKFITWLETEYIDKGLNIRDEATMAEFRENFSDMVKETTWQKINQLVNTTMARVQNFGQTMKLYEAGFKRFRIVGPKTYPICEYCKLMVGRVFEVEAAAVRLSGIVQKGFEDPKDLPPFVTNKYKLEDLEKATDEQLQAEGFESPPYHPECRHRKAAED
jgi:ssDNA-binding Zn-finger/Zn-ribbon topoisomerase 1